MELLAENAFLRQQLLVAARHVRRPGFRVWDRLILVILAAVLANWRSAVILVKPETLLRWHRDVFRLLWMWRSRHTARAKPACPPRRSRSSGAWPPGGQRWSTFLRNQGAGIWSCDLFEARDLWFRCHFVFVVMHLAARRILLAATTTAPSADWLAQQLWQLTAFGLGPKFLLRDNDAKLGTVFDDVAKGAGVRVIRTSVMAPKSNAHCERLIGSVRRECLDHVLVLGGPPSAHP